MYERCTGGCPVPLAMTPLSVVPQTGNYDHPMLLLLRDLGICHTIWEAKSGPRCHHLLQCLGLLPIHLCPQPPRLMLVYGLVGLKSRRTTFGLGSLRTSGPITPADSWLAKVWGQGIGGGGFGCEQKAVKLERLHGNSYFRVSMVLIQYLSIFHGACSSFLSQQIV